MDIFNSVSSELKKNGINLFSPIPLSSCTVLKKYLLDREDISDGTVFVCAVPYLTRECVGDHNISAYCAVRDYHGFFDGIAGKILPVLRENHPGERFAFFADRSPIDERDAAAKAGLGMIGKNGMLITEKYSSYVFLGELVTSAVIPCAPREPVFCEGCGLCKKFCPADDIGVCLSALTQKKGGLTEREASALIKYGSVWGCDICQKVCPHTVLAIADGSIFTDVPYFLDGVIPDLDSVILNALDDREFSSRAFSWRGRDTVKRNLDITEKKK